MNTNMNTNNNATLTQAENKVVVLSIDGLKLILPQGDIRTVESIGDVELTEKVPQSIGTINYRGQRWPVVCLSHELILLGVVPASRRACVMLACDGNYLGLLCDDARVLVNFMQQSFTMPNSMRTHDSPITSLIQYEQGLACLSNASRLYSYVNLTSITLEEEVH